MEAEWDSIETNQQQPRGWSTRLLEGVGLARASRRGPHLNVSDQGNDQAKPLGLSPCAEDPRAFARRLIAEGREVFVLLQEAVEHVDDRAARPGWDSLERGMALVPGGGVPVTRSNGIQELVEVSAFYLDRHAVTNLEYQRFVRAGGYDALEIWPREVWPSLMKFVDRTGRAGPLDWEKGVFPAKKADHPVTGVSWYEALAYSRWVGKRLPTAEEWQKAGGWPEALGGGNCNRYPWGDVFDPARANLRACGLGETASVEAFARGSTPNGIAQMAGNVWEWLDDPLETIPNAFDSQFQPWRPMRRIVGGAFDTYLPHEATCQFVTGQAEIDRRPNLGFRCAISLDRLRNQ